MVLFSVPLIAGLFAAGVVAVAAWGLWTLRADPLAGLEAKDIALIRARRRIGGEGGPLGALGRRLGPVLGSVLGERQQAALARRLELAGNPGGDTLERHLERRARMLAVYGVGGLVLLARGLTVLALLALAVAVILPELVLRSSGQRRQQQIERDLPDFLDVLAVTVSAGLSFRAALDRVAARHTGPLAEEIIYALRQMDLGESRSEAFARVRQRNDSPALESFISALLQAEELGAPITDTLAQIAREMRRSVAQSARRRAARRAPQISLVVTMVMVPGTLVLLLAALLLSSGLNLGGLGL